MPRLMSASFTEVAEVQYPELLAARCGVLDYFSALSTDVVAANALFCASSYALRLVNAVPGEFVDNGVLGTVEGVMGGTFPLGAELDELLAQHRGLWDLLESRQAARGDLAVDGEVVDEALDQRWREILRAQRRFARLRPDQQGRAIRAEAIRHRAQFGERSGQGRQFGQGSRIVGPPGSSSVRSILQILDHGGRPSRLDRPHLHPKPAKRATSGSPPPRDPTRVFIRAD